MKKEMTFEEAMLRLEEIVGMMETGTQSLEDSLKLFEEGALLAEYCNSTLSKAKLKITELTESQGNEIKPEEEKQDE